MMTTTKKVLIISGVILAGYLIITADKLLKMKAIFDKMTLFPASIPKNIKLINRDYLGIPTSVSFTIDVKLENPTGEDFSVSGQLAKLTQINIFYNNKFVGTANVDIVEISVPSRNSIVFHDIKIEVPINSILDNYSELANMNINKISATGVIDVLGVSYNIG